MIYRAATYTDHACTNAPSTCYERKLTWKRTDILSAANVCNKKQRYALGNFAIYQMCQCLFQGMHDKSITMAEHGFPIYESSTHRVMHNRMFALNLACDLPLGVHFAVTVGCNIP